MIPAQVIVCATCAVRSLDAALAGARPGTTIVVDGSVRGRAVVRVPHITIAGRNDAAIDGGGGTAVAIEAPDVRLTDLTVRGAGTDPDGKAAAIIVRAPRAVLERLHLSGDAFGIGLFGAHGTRIADVTIDGLWRTRPDVAGDGFRAWASDGVTLDRVAIRDARDVLLSYCAGMTIRHSVVRGGRYGIHDMYSPSLHLDGVRVENAEIALNLMYADRPDVAHSVFAGARGPAGYGVALEGVTRARIHDDAFIDDHVGLMVTGTAAGSDVAIERNVFLHDATGLAAETSTGGVTVHANTFLFNLEQVASTGAGGLRGIAWDGNFWSDYAGYDRNGDGRGDVIYAPASAYESLADAHPGLRLFTGTPAARALDFAARALPAIAPAPKLVDRHPLMKPALARHLPAAPPSRPPALAWGLAALFLGPLAALGARNRRGGGVPRRAGRTACAVADAPAVQLRGVTKRYGPARGIFDASLSVARGEAVALWGPNGAGKTTLMRCVLGQVRCAGDVAIFGVRSDAERAAARALVGYAPQQLPDAELDARELAELVCALRGDAASGDLLARVGIADSGDVRVGSLSGGMRQRLGLALALAGDPPLLVLDEPSAGLDRASRRAALALLQEEKRRGTTLLFTSHLLEDVRALADRVIRIEDGRIVEILTRDAFLREEAA